MREKDILREAREFVELRKEEMRDNDISEMEYLFHDIELMQNMLKLCIYKEDQNKKLRKIIKKLNDERFIYTIEGKEVEKEEFVNYVVEMCKENENHIPHID